MDTPTSPKMAIVALLLAAAAVSSTSVSATKSGHTSVEKDEPAVAVQEKDTPRKNSETSVSNPPSKTGTTKGCPLRRNCVSSSRIDVGPVAPTAQPTQANSPQGTDVVSHLSNNHALSPS